MKIKHDRKYENAPGTAMAAIRPSRAAVLVHQRENQVEVTIVFKDGNWEAVEFESIARAMAAIQCPENHNVPAWIDGYPTIINAWLKSQIAAVRAHIQPRFEPGRPASAIDGQSRGSRAKRIRPETTSLPPQHL